MLAKLVDQVVHAAQKSPRCCAKSSGAASEPAAGLPAADALPPGSPLRRVLGKLSSEMVLWMGRVHSLILRLSREICVPLYHAERGSQFRVPVGQSAGLSIRRSEPTTNKTRIHELSSQDRGVFHPLRHSRGSGAPSGGSCRIIPPDCPYAAAGRHEWDTNKSFTPEALRLNCGQRHFAFYAISGFEMVRFSRNHSLDHRLSICHHQFDGAQKQTESWHPCS